MNVFPFSTTAGKPQPFGVSYSDKITNFSIVCRHAKNVSLCFFNYSDALQPFYEVALDPDKNKTGDVWHLSIYGLDQEYLYKYRLDNSPTFTLDPYAHLVSSGNVWGGHPAYLPLAGVKAPLLFDWEGSTTPSIPLNDLVIYEMHVRGFTRHPSSKVRYPGTFLGVIDKIPHLLDLGINAIELLPIFEFNESEYKHNNPVTNERLYNYWGYSTMHFFAPMQRYASTSFPPDAVHEFKQMVRELHKNGIEVILDVVYNHTGEGGLHEPAVSFKALDCEVYYLINGIGVFENFSGCGNTTNCNHPIFLELILQSLRYWRVEMGVDGFRFDLASIFYRGTNGIPLSIAPIVEAITNDPILAQVKLIAEPWDAAGFYQVGNFSPHSMRWSEWNDRYRNAVRNFIKGTGNKGEFATRICGSQDLYFSRYPTNSINYVTCHDGFTLADLVSYNRKHNIENGEDNRDGMSDNQSWNCGTEGVTHNNDILALRIRQMRNFMLALLISRGIPMLHMGDEYGHTKEGNNNTWCQDNELNWFLWNHLHENTFYRFVKGLIHFRQSHAILRENKFLCHEEIDWHGRLPHHPNWQKEDNFIAFTLKSKLHQDEIYLAFNANTDLSLVTFPSPPPNSSWKWVVNTSHPSPEDFYPEPNLPLVTQATYHMLPFSSLMLESVFIPSDQGIKTDSYT